MRRLIFISLTCIFAICGCQNKKAEPKPEADTPTTRPTESPEDAAKLRARQERDRMQAKKLAESGQVLPPRPTIAFNVVERNDRISLQDAEHSFEFVSAPITSCYMRVLAFDLTAQGDTVLAIDATKDRDGKCTVKQSDIHAEDFEECVLKACKNWPVPGGATMEIRLAFSSKPAPTVEELREINRQIMGGDGHDHEGHDHAGDSHVRVPELPVNVRDHED